MIPFLSFVGRSQNVASDLIMIQHDLLSKGSIVSSEPLSSSASITRCRELGVARSWKGDDVVSDSPSNLSLASSR